MKAGSIYIKGTQQSIELKQDASFPFTLTKSIAEIQDLSSRDKTHSKTFVIPATESNIKALGYPHVLGTDLDSIAVFKQGCLVIVNGNVIDEGFLYILNARKGVNVTEFECQFIGGSEPWVIALQNLYMKDVQYDSSGSALSVLYSDDNIRDRYLANPRTYANPEYLFINPYMYQFSDNALTIGADTYNGDSRNAKGDDFWACFRLDKLIDGIFGTATNPLVTYVNSFQSFQFSSVFFQQNDTGASHGFWDNIYYSDRSEDEYLTGSGAQVVANGALNIWGDFLPREMTMLDFFMQCVKTFNLVFDFDGITLRVEPRQNWTSWNGTEYTGFYSGTVDWSDKLSIEQEVQYKTSNYKRQIRLTYETDSYPVEGSEYPYLSDKKINQPEVRYLIDIENNAEEGVSDIVLPFNTSPSKFYQAKFDYKRKNGQSASYSTTRVIETDSITFDPGVKYANRLFVFKAGSKPMGLLYNDFGVQAHQRLLVQDPRWRNWTYEEEDGTTHVNTSYPYIYNVITVNPFAHSSHTEAITGIGNVNTITGAQSDWDTIDNVDPINPTISGGSAVGDPMTNIVPTDPDDINLGIYKSNTVNMPNGLYERFWKSTIDLLKVSRTLVTRVHMTRNEFVTLDQSKFYTALGQVFILNKVSDFDPLLDEQMVEVELLMANAVRGSEITPGSVSIDAISGAGTQSNIITGTSSTAIFGRGVQLQRGRYVYFMGQLSNADNQTMTATGVTQTGATLTTSSSPTAVFNGTADFDPYARGQAGGIARLTDTKAVMIAPIFGTGNEFKICTYTGGTSNVSVDFSVNDGDSANYVDRQPNFAVINVSGDVYTIASVGLTRGGAFPYARVWDLDLSSQSITPRGILYPMGTSGSGNGQQQLVNLGTVNGKKCFAIFYAKSASSTGVLYYAVYEYDTSTNTLVEAIGDTLYKSGSNHITGDRPWSIEDGKGVLAYLDRVAYDTEVTTCIYNGSTLTIGTPGSFGNVNVRGLDIEIVKYYNGSEDSTTEYIMCVGLWESSVRSGEVIVFPAVYDPVANTWDVSKFDTADSDLVIDDPSNPTASRPIVAPMIGQVDTDNGAIVTCLRTLGNTSFRGVSMNNFEIENS